MRRKFTSLVRQVEGSPYWFENFTVNGKRFRASLGTASRKDAERTAAERKAEAERAIVLGIETAKHGMTVYSAIARYYDEHGKHLATADDMVRIGAVLIDGLGSQTPLMNLSPPMLTSYAARRRNGRSNRSVNVELGHLRAVLYRARDLWDEPVPKLIWKNLMLEEAGLREHILSDAKEERLFAALRVDHHAMVRFALVTGLRLGNVIRLRWPECDGDQIAVRVKSKKPNGKLIKVPITADVRAILDGERGRHPEFVFTYVCERTRHDPRRGIIQHKGQRYPFTQNGWRKDFSAALRIAEIDDFRFHDLRHTAATRILKATGNLATVKKLMAHENIQTTMRYAHSDIDDVREAMEAVARRRAPVRLIAKEETGS